MFIILLMFIILRMYDIFNFKLFWNNLSNTERKAFSKSAGLSEQYIAVHLRYARKSQRLQTIMKLYKACNTFRENVILEQVANYFVK